MPSSTSSSRRLTAADRPGVAQPVPVRDLPDRPWRSMLWGALLLAVALTGVWEWHWRAFGVTPGIRDDYALWARQRRKVDEGMANATVLIGASRTLFDIQLPVWERLSGRRPIQLALVGTSPLFALEDLAADAAFKGRVLVGVTPDIFFSGFEYQKGLIQYFRKETPSQRVGKLISMHLVEPWLAFYDQDFALFTVLRRQRWPARKDLQGGTAVRKLLITEQDRNSYLWSKLETDPGYRNLARSIWAEDFEGPATPQEKAENQRALETQIARASAAIERLRARGVPVLFVRHPSGGDYLAFEDREFPRRTTWDVLLAGTHAPGVHFQDYPELQGYDLPEWSHMTRRSAERYTEALYRIIARDYTPPTGARW
jgi:hypothetical protein